MNKQNGVVVPDPCAYTAMKYVHTYDFQYTVILKCIALQCTNMLTLSIVRRRRRKVISKTTVWASACHHV
jgi:hypothetical protein